MRKRTFFGMLAAMSDAVVGAGAVSPDFAQAAYVSETLSKPNVNKTVKRQPTASAVVNFIGEPLYGRV
jgi:hypothetical protein